MENKNAPLVVFDLDGTLSRSHVCILESVRRTLRAFGLPQVSDEYVKSLIGEQYETFFRKIAPGCKDYAAFERIFTEVEHEVIRECGELYPGVAEMLRTLRDEGCATALLSNGSLEYEELVTTATGIRSMFDMLVSGGDFPSKTEALTYIIDRFPRGLAAMVGDHRHDVNAALGNNATAIAALYGYGSHGELSAAHYFVHEPSEIVDVIHRIC